MPKKIAVNLSTLVDLKAELFRKQEQAQKQKQDRKNEITPIPSSSSTSAAGFIKGGKPILYEARKAAAVQEKLQRKGPQSAEQRRKLEELESALREEERQLARSKERLQAKAALYEKLQNARDEGPAESEGLYLVNFEQKAVEERPNSDESDHDAGDEADWVEYTDVLGRTRKCLRQDLPKFMAADDRLKERDGRDNTKEKQSTSTEVNDQSELLSEDMRRELKRKAWEKEETDAATAPKGPVHYQHLAVGESRELGVGYFPFAPDEQIRHEQMRQLDDLRQQTISQRNRAQQLKEKRQTALKARLEKVAERKKLKGEDGEPVFIDDSDDEDVANLKLDEIPLPPSAPESSKIEGGQSTSAAAAKKSNVRPWDIGKPKLRQEQWVEKRRGERSNEFAPPSFY